VRMLTGDWRVPGEHQSPLQNFCLTKVKWNKPWSIRGLCGDRLATDCLRRGLASVLTLCDMWMDSVFTSPVCFSNTTTQLDVTLQFNNMLRVLQQTVHQRI